jgi:hypothetical protein
MQVEKILFTNVFFSLIIMLVKYVSIDGIPQTFVFFRFRIHPAQPTDAPSSQRSSLSHFYTLGFPRGWPLLRGLVPLGQRNLEIKTLEKQTICEEFISW